jgi:hypothetical protein
LVEDTENDAMAVGNQQLGGGLRGGGGREQKIWKRVRPDSKPVSVPKLLKDMYEPHDSRREVLAGVERLREIVRDISHRAVAHHDACLGIRRFAQAPKIAWRG